MTQAFKISCDWELDKVDTADRKRVLAKRDHGFLLPKEKKKQTELQVYHSCGIYELALQLLDQWIYKQRFRKHNQVKISKRKERRFGGK